MFTARMKIALIVVVAVTSISLINSVQGCEYKIIYMFICDNCYMLTSSDIFFLNTLTDIQTTIYVSFRNIHDFFTSSKYLCF